MTLSGLAYDHHWSVKTPTLHMRMSMYFSRAAACVQCGHMAPGA